MCMPRWTMLVLAGVLATDDAWRSMPPQRAAAAAELAASTHVVDTCVGVLRVHETRVELVWAKTVRRLGRNGVHESAQVAHMALIVPTRGRRCQSYSSGPTKVSGQLPQEQPAASTCAVQPRSLAPQATRIFTAQIFTLLAASKFQSSGNTRTCEGYPGIRSSNAQKPVKAF